MRHGEEKYDVIVVGAGPAGSTAARHCAQGGLKTLLLEKERFPRFKPCAGGVTLGAVQELGINIPRSIIERTCTGMRVLVRRMEKEIRLTKPVSLMVDRSTFDQHLAAMAVEAGAAFADGEGCKEIKLAANNVIVETDKRVLNTPVIIGADGYFSKTRKKFRPGFEQDEIRYCVIAEIPMPSTEISRRFKDLVTIYYGFASMGYAWIFPKRSHLSVGVGGAPSQSRDMSNRLREFLSLNQLDPNTTIKGCFIPVSRWRHNTYTDRILLAGDAAGLVDSFSGEGIRFAIISGRLAAETVITAHSKADFSERTLRSYHEHLRDYLGHDMDSSNRITDLLFRYPNLILGTIVRNDEALEQYLLSVVGDIRFSDYVQWLKGRLPSYLTRRFLLPW